MILNLGTPNEKQLLALQDKHRYLAYGGARGGGKSWFVQTKTIILCLRWPGIRVLIVRKTCAEVINNHAIFLQEKLHGIAKYNKSEKVFRFGNGSTITLAYCANDSHLDQFQGVQYDVVFIDEATQLREEWIKKIIMCNRGVNEFPKKMVFTMNPGGPSHSYFKRLFVDRRFNENEDPEEYHFLQALVTDNRALLQAQPDYLKQLDTLVGKLYDAWRWGRWDVFEGMVFEEFSDRPEHYDDGIGTHVINPFRIPESWSVWRSMDWGYSHPFSVHWTAINHEDPGRMYVIRELYGCTGEPDVGVKWDPARVAQEIINIEASDPNLKGRHIMGVADPAIWGTQGTESIANHMERAGVYFQRGNHDRLNGLMQVHWRLSFDEDGRPRMYIFKTCRHLIRTLPLLQYSETNVEDVDTSLEDHAYDEIRYLCMEHPVNPPAGTRKEIPLDDPLDLFADQRKAMRRRL